MRQEVLGIPCVELRPFAEAHLFQRLSKLGSLHEPAARRELQRGLVRARAFRLFFAN